MSWGIAYCLRFYMSFKESLRPDLSKLLTRMVIEKMFCGH